MFMMQDSEEQGGAVNPAPPGGRIPVIDVLRGLCVVLMATFHFSYDLYFYCAFPPIVIDNFFMTFCQVFSSWGFILLAGLSSRLSRSNIKRGVVVLCGGAAVSVVSYLWGDFIRFGILQFLGCAMVIYGLSRALWERVPRRFAPFLYLGLFIIAIRMLPITLEVPYLYPFGFITPTFRSADYFPLFPWFFWFLLGTWLGEFVKEGRLSEKSGKIKVRPLAFLGRHSFAVYFIHQPVLVAVSAILALLTGHKLPF